MSELKTELVRIPLPYDKRSSQIFNDRGLGNMRGYTLFLWEWCKLCECAFIRCPYCGNNICNATFGILEDDSYCPICNLAYQYEKLAFDVGEYPKTPSEIKARNKKIKGRNA